MEEAPKCLAYPFQACVGDGTTECYNESCVKKDKCRSEVLVSAEASVMCGKLPHTNREKHYVELKEHFGETMVTITWPSRKDKFK